jgi:UTP--glucose-1-phosphate uridylyltransferase
VIKARPVESRVHQVLDLVEKPRPGDAPSDLAIIGRYVLPPEIFEILAGTGADACGEIQLTDALRMLRARRPIYAVEFEGRRYDTGDKLGFLKATVEFALARPELASTSNHISVSLLTTAFWLLRSAFFFLSQVKTAEAASRAGWGL